MSSQRKGYQWTFAFTIKWRRFLRPHLYDKEEDVWQALWRSALAEFFGTLIFVFFGTASVTSSLRLITNARDFIASGSASASFISSMVSSATSQLVLIAFGFGFGLAVVIYAVGEISGGHVNPAVTWATLITGRLSVLRFVLYVTCQLLGAMTGSAINKTLTNDLQFALGCNMPNHDIGMSANRALGAEIVFTFIFVFVVFATAISPFQQKLAPLAAGGADYGPGKLTPIALGLCILCLHLVGVPVTGLSANPARSFGVAVALSNVRGEAHRCWVDHWVFWAGPIIGATIAAVVATALFLGNPKTVKTVLLISRGRDRFERLIIPESKAEYDTKVLPDHRTTLDVISQQKDG